MGESAKRCLDTTQHHRHIRIELLENTGVDDSGILRPHVMAAVGRVGILGAQSTCSSVLVDHRVHAAWRNAEEEARTSQLLEVAIVAVPVGLGHDGHTVAGILQHPADDSSTKRGVVDIGVGREQDDIHLIPASQFQLLLRRWQKISQSILH